MPEVRVDFSRLIRHGRVVWFVVMTEGAISNGVIELTLGGVSFSDKVAMSVDGLIWVDLHLTVLVSDK